MTIIISLLHFVSSLNRTVSVKTCIPVLLTILLTCVRDGICVWESLVFLIADHKGADLNVKCARFSSYSCLYGYMVDDKVRDYIWDDKYNQVFQILIQRKFKQINWFSLQDNELGRCCNFQSEMYEFNGRMMGMSPAEYYHRIMDFTTSNKHLNYLKIQNSSSCGAFISAVGYGVGPLKVVSDIPISEDHLFMKVADGHYIFSTTDEMEATATFDWFKWCNICKEQPWICALEMQDRKR